MYTNVNMSNNNDNNNNHYEHVITIEDHGTGTSHQLGLKKGPWSAAEDAVLMDYVKRNGEGNWNAVQRNTGLMRCGKSCRLRWANHLRPNLKKGGFSLEEERIILDLHSKIGNKWARMASQLPGRTDNEIKNFWNTRLKRRQRAGLPLYPQGNLEGSTTFNHFNQEINDQQINSQQKYSIFTPNCHPLFNPNNFSSFTTSKLPLMQNFHFGFFGHDGTTINGGDISGLANLPLSTYLVSPYSGASPSSSTNPMYNQNIGFQATATPPLTPPVDHYDNNNDDELENNHVSFTSMIMGSAHVLEPFGSPDVVPRIESELPSNQNNYFLSYPMSPASFSTSAYGLENSSGDVNYNNEGGENCEPGLILLSSGDQERRINSGLLDALLVEAKSLSSRQLVKVPILINPDYECSNVAPLIGKRKCEVDESDEEEEEEAKRAGSKRIKFSLKNGSEISDENQSYVGSSQSPIDNCGNYGTKPSEGSSPQLVQEANSIDDDLLSLLNNFPPSMPLVLPDWCNRRTNEYSNVCESGPGDHHENGGGVIVDQDASLTQATNEEGFASCHWSNRSGLC